MAISSLPILSNIHASNTIHDNSVLSRLKCCVMKSPMEHIDLRRFKFNVFFIKSLDLINLCQKCQLLIDFCSFLYTSFSLLILIYSLLLNMTFFQIVYLLYVNFLCTTLLLSIISPCVIQHGFCGLAIE